METWQIISANIVPLLGLAALVGASHLLNVYRGRPRRLIEEIKQQNPHLLYCDRVNRPARFRLEQIDLNMDDHWQRALLVITPQQFALYSPYTRRIKPFFRCTPDELQGFWRVEPQQDDKSSALWIHVRSDDRWSILQVRYDDITMAQVVGALREFAHEEQERASRRPRPYIHRGPVAARIAHQTIHGAWELHDAVRLYVMPLFLVIFQSGRVQRQIALADLRDIVMLPRMDDAPGEGLVSLYVAENGERLVFALRDYQAWADDLAQAARRTLEAPVLQKQKDAED